MRKIMKAILMAGVLGVPLLPVFAQADYIGPEEFLSLPWGKGDGEIGIVSAPRGEYCSLPYDSPIFSVDADGIITLLDYCNQKIKFFHNGALHHVAQPDRKTVEGLSNVPMEKGKEFKWERVGEYGGKATVAFESGTVELARHGEYYRDGKGFFYSLLRRSEVWKFDPSGREAGSLSLRYQVLTDREHDMGGPVLDPRGDVYFWKWYPDRFRILKWTWREAQALYGMPDAPRYIEAVPTKKGIAVTWWFPFQNQESITGFEILRSERSGAPLKRVGAVSREQVKGFIPVFEDTSAERGVTYYYRMRTMLGEKYSVYSNEAVGRR